MNERPESGEAVQYAPPPAAEPVADVTPPGEVDHPVASSSPPAPTADTVRLDRAHAERVIARALELQDAHLGRPDGLTLEEVAEVAGQLGVAPDLVRRAALDVRLAGAVEHEPSTSERLLGPARITGATSVPVDVDAARQAVDRWMTTDEGMRMRGTSAGRQRWGKDARVVTEIKRGLGSPRATGILRGLDEVDVTVEALDDATVVTVEADTRKIQKTGVAIAAGSTLAGVAFGVGAATIIPDAAGGFNDLGQFGLTFGVWTAGGAATAVSVCRSWTTRVRRAVADALDGINMTTTWDGPELVEDRPGWRSTVLRWLDGNR